MAAAGLIDESQANDPAAVVSIAAHMMDRPSVSNWRMSARRRETAAPRRISRGEFFSVFPVAQTAAFLSRPARHMQIVSSAGSTSHSAPQNPPTSFLVRRARDRSDFDMPLKSALIPEETRGQTTSVEDEIYLAFVR